MALLVYRLRCCHHGSSLAVGAGDSFALPVRDPRTLLLHGGRDRGKAMAG